jgi:mono/diheme cytochrome c family protein
MRRNYIIGAGLGLMQLLAQPNVSYRTQIAPIFAFHCNGCHGDNGVAAEFDTRSIAALRKGGERENDIVPGDPEASVVVQLIEGRRGEQHRMPLGSRPLTREQIEQMRAWIRAGAADDEAAVPLYRLALPNIAWGGAPALRISCRLPTEAYLLLRLSSSGKVLHEESASVRRQPERMNAGAPGDRITWTLYREQEWPARLDVELEIRYAPAEPIGARLDVADDAGHPLGYRELR